MASVSRYRCFMKTGDVIEAAIWITGDESPSLRAHYEQDVRQAISDMSATARFEHGPVTFTEKRPGDDRVPPVPDHVQGSRVRLLVAESAVTAVAIQTPKGSFVANLENKDLLRLRLITRSAAKTVLTDDECDKIIEEIGPEAAVETLRKNVGVSVH